MGVKRKKKNNPLLHEHEAGAPARASLMKAFSLMWRLWVPLNTLRDRRRAAPSVFEGVSLQQTPRRGREKPKPLQVDFNFERRHMKSAET